MIVQIYAVTSVHEALATARLGVDQVGFVAGVYHEVYGELTFAEAHTITQALRGKAQASALTMSTDPDEIGRMVRAVLPDIVHISSETEAVGVEAVAELRRSLPAGVSLMKAIAVAGPESVDVALQFAPVADILLLDTGVKGLPGVGATEVVHDWNVSRQIVAAIKAAPHLQTKVILAGGLTAANVAEAIRVVRPWGVDSNTGTNIPGDPVKKDLTRVGEFVKQAKGL